MEPQINSSIFKANSTLGMIKRTFKFKIKICLLYKTFVQPQLEYEVSVWRPNLKKDIHATESVQRRETKLVPEKLYQTDIYNSHCGFACTNSDLESFNNCIKPDLTQRKQLSVFLKSCIKKADFYSVNQFQIHSFLNFFIISDLARIPKRYYDRTKDYKEHLSATTKAAIEGAGISLDPSQ
ncbi:unnamed protein product [Brachionus calyciflorus]|uniref:Uncharacterized protein n=1 Tax=Brachionus calyciflorus TaxID=104777 RepID=A0A813QU75_9BILA|nr:unnamed protein product [Brachionus calyciflorus]